MTENQKFARQCDVTGEGMNEGYCFDDGCFYAKYEADALKHAQELGYNTLEEAYKDEAYYWTEWEDEEDFQYIVKDGKLVEIEEDCDEYMSADDSTDEPLQEFTFEVSKTSVVYVTIAAATKEDAVDTLSEFHVHVEEVENPNTVEMVVRLEGEYIKNLV